jgi:hypothetical protein
MKKISHKQITPFVNVLFSLTLVVWLTSCGPSMKTYRLYDGPQRPTEETVLLLCEGKTAQLNSINGQKSPKGKNVFGNVTLEILPGDYQLTVSFSGKSMEQVSGGNYYYHIFYQHDSLENVDITMEAEAGHTYLLTSDHDYGKSRWHAILMDQTNEKRILKLGPYPLNTVRTGDNRATRYRGRE